MRCLRLLTATLLSVGPPEHGQKEVQDTSEGLALSFRLRKIHSVTKGHMHSSYGCTGLQPVPGGGRKDRGKERWRFILHLPHLPSLGPPFQWSLSTLTFQFPVTLSSQTRVIINSHIRLFKFRWETPHKNTLKDKMRHLDVRCLFLLAPRFGRSQQSKCPSRK